jgi:hypothetical protein
MHFEILGEISHIEIFSDRELLLGSIRLRDVARSGDPLE